MTGVEMAGTSKKSQLVTIRVPNEVHARLLAEAARLGVTLTTVVQKRLAQPSFEYLVINARPVTPASPEVVPWPGPVSISDSVGG